MVPFKSGFPLLHTFLNCTIVGVYKERETKFLRTIIKVCATAHAPTGIYTVRKVRPRNSHPRDGYYDAL